LEKAGQPGGPEVRKLALTLPLGDEDARSKLADELMTRRALGPELVAAARGQRRLVVGLSNLESSIGRNTQGRISDDAGMDRLRAGDETRKFLFRLQRTGAYFFKNSGYLTVLDRLASQRARELLAKGDAAGAVRESDKALAILPGIYPAETLVPELAKAGHKAEADQVYAAAAAVSDKLCKDFPQSAAFRNERAWLAARCRRDLEMATELARKAVDLDPEHVNYRDTLAEVLFQRGDKDAALSQIKKCLEMEPANKRYAKLKARIEYGDRDAPLPER
jgi:tetratricopeptide (TPR) repeat protein